MKKLTLLAATALVVSACSTSNPAENWTNYTSDSLSASQLSDNQSLAVFYRTENVDGPAVNVYLNGHYHTSLLEKGYSPVTLCANSQQLITASYTNEGFGNRTKGGTHSLVAKEITYFRAVTGKNNSVSFEKVDSEIASNELQGLNGKVAHGLSRVRSNCK